MLMMPRLYKEILSENCWIRNYKVRLHKELAAKKYFERVVKDFLGKRQKGNQIASFNRE